jgi:hypothetical protein
VETMGPVGSGPQSLLASLKTVGNSFVSGVNALTSRENIPGEQVKFVKFAVLEDPGCGEHHGKLGHTSYRVLLLGYETGFQVWIIEDGEAPTEILSHREEAVR